MDYRIKKTIGKNIAINTKTQEEYDELMKFLDKNGFEWLSGAKIAQKNYWQVYQNQTCINFETQNELCYANAEYYQKGSYEIISYQEFMKKENELKIEKGFNGDYAIKTPFEIENVVWNKNAIQIIPKKEILDDVEKEYLRNVIKPFKNRVKCIVKISYGYKEYIIISLSEEEICMPSFKKNAMYKGMEKRKRYTLEELGL